MSSVGNDVEKWESLNPPCVPSYHVAELWHSSWLHQAWMPTCSAPANGCRINCSRKEGKNRKRRRKGGSERRKGIGQIAFWFLIYPVSITKTILWLESKSILFTQFPLPGIAPTLAFWNSNHSSNTEDKCLSVEPSLFTQAHTHVRARIQTPAHKQSCLLVLLVSYGTVYKLLSKHLRNYMRVDWL